MGIISILSVIFVTILFIKYIMKKPKNLPPGPRKLPLIGNLHNMAKKNTLPHHRLAELATEYGPIMHLKLGEVSTVVFSTAEMAKEALKNHDVSLCSRPRLRLAEIVFYDSSDIGLTPYGEYWRKTRKIATLELFTALRIRKSFPIRVEEIFDLINSIIPDAKAGKVINLSNKIFNYNFNVVLRLSMNKKGKDGEGFKRLLEDINAVISGFSVTDLYPSLQFLDSITGMEGKLQDILKRLNKLMDPIVEEHLCSNSQGKEEEDLIDIFLKYHESNPNANHELSLTSNNIKAIIFSLFGAASETSSTTLEWAMTEMLKNPKVMEKAQSEVRRVFPGNDVNIDEKSLDELKYLKFVLKETLRLHPPLPMLIPHESREKCEINGYEIPQGTRVLINVWAIGRDGKCWKDPEKFIPERFEGTSVDYKGTYYELIPFGAGRRMCPGMPLASPMMEFALAMLLYHFDWKLPHGITPEDLDMAESFGLVARRCENLKLIPMLYSV